MAYEGIAPSSVTPSSTPAPSTSKPRKTRSRRVITSSRSIPSATVAPPPPAGTVVGYTAGRKPSYPEPAWGPSYYKPRPGLFNTLTQLRAQIGDDRQTSYILGDLLEARYENQNDFRYNYFSKQADDVQHGLKLADIAAQNGDPYQVPTYEVDGLPRSESPQALLKQMAVELSKVTDDGAKDAIASVFKKRIEDAYDIQNDTREQEGRLSNYMRDFENTQEERGLRDGYSDARAEEKDGNPLPPWYLPQALYSDKQNEAAIARTLTQGVSGAFKGILNGSGKPPEQEGFLHSIATAPVVGGPVATLAEHVNGGDNPVNNALKRIGDEVEDPLLYTLDKLTRPIQGIDMGLNALLATKDKSGNAHGLTGFAGNSTMLGVLTGQNPLDSVAEVVQHPSNIPRILGAAARGVYGMGEDEAFTPKNIASGIFTNDDDLYLGPDLIKDAAERNPEKTIQDSKNWQLWGGLANDLVLDPLNFVAPSKVVKPLEWATEGPRATIADHTNTLRIRRNAAKIAQFVKDSEFNLGKGADGLPIQGPAERDIIDPNEITEMYLGKSIRRPRNEAERKEFMDAAPRAAQRLENYINSRTPVGKVGREGIERVKQTLANERQRVVDKFASDTYMDELQKLLDTKIARGDIPLHDYEETINTAKVYDIIDEGIAHEKMLDKAANEKLWDGLGLTKDSGKRTWSDIEAERDRLTAAVARGDVPEDRLQEFQNMMDSALDPNDPANYIRNINELMGPSWQADPRIGAEETQRILRQAMRLAGSETRESNTALRVTKNKRTTSYETWGKTTDEGKKAYIKEGIGRQDNAIRAYENKIRAQTADLFVRLIKSNLIQREGGKVYGNTEEVKALQEVLAETDRRAELLQRADDSGHTTRDPALSRGDSDKIIGPIDGPVDPKTREILDNLVKPETGAKGDINPEVGPKEGEWGKQKVGKPKNEPVEADGARTDLDENGNPYVQEGADLNFLKRNEDGSLSPDLSIFDQFSPEFVRKMVVKQLRFHEFNPETGRNVMPPEKTPLPPTPTRLLDENGTLDRSKLERAFEVTRFGDVIPRYTGDPEIDTWIKQAADVVHENYALKSEKIRERLIREKNATNQQARVEAITSELGPRGQQVGKMFTIGKTKEGHPKVGLPYVTLNGQRVTKDDFEALGQLVTHQDKQRTTALQRTLNELQQGGAEAAKNRSQALGRLRDYLRGIGKAVPDSPKDLVPWLLGDDAEIVGVKGTDVTSKVRKIQDGTSRIEGLLTDLNPENIAFQRLFEKEHGMTIGSAMVERDYLVGKTVLGVGPWAKRFPRGATLRDIKYLATNSLDDYRYLVEKSPLGRFLHPGTAESEKMARDAAKVAGGDHSEWFQRNYNRLMAMPSARRDAYIQQQFEKAIKKQTREPDQASEELLKKNDQIFQDRKLTHDQYSYIHRMALKDTLDKVERSANEGALTKAAGNTEFSLEPPVGYASSPESINRIIKQRFGEEKAALHTEKFRAARAGAAKDQELLTDLDARLANVERQEKEWATEHRQLLAEAYAAKQEMVKALKTDAVLRAATLSLAGTETKLGINFLGKIIEVPNSQKLFQTVERASGVPLIKEMRQLFSDAFGSPARSLNSEVLQEARAISLGQAPIIIEHKIRRLQHTLGKFPQGTREQAQKNMLRGSEHENEVTQAINDAFGPDVMEAFQGKKYMPDRSDPTNQISLAEINRYLPAGLKLSEAQLKRGINTASPKALIKELTGGKPKKMRIKDPYRIAWLTHVALEQAKGRKAVQYVVKEGHGVRKVDANDPSYEALRHLPGLGWREVESIGGSHLFPPEIARDVDRLFQMLEPTELSPLGRLLDRATGYWKTATTVYNPGYWTRNAVGEAMSSWLAGVNNPMVYKKAKNVVFDYWRGDGQELKVLSEQFPWLKHTEQRAVKDSDIVSHTGSGHALTAEDYVVLFNDQSLKTGFFNTEFDAHVSKAGDVARGLTGGKAGDIHQGVRSAGEWFEDYFRMAHFIHAMEKNKGTIEEAAKAAAAEVRKYHFDYTDFSNFEKTVMLRAFPFYKWTRKALPLMTTMLFTKPGKVMAYPKVMNTISNTVSTRDVGEDDNGFAPNYEGIVPAWMQDMWAYQITDHEDEKATDTYFNLNTPQFDSYKTLTNPGNTAYGLLNPAFKAPDQILNGITGHSIGEVVGQNPYVNSSPSGVMEALLKNVPQGNYLTKEGFSGDATAQERATFLTGGGIFGNTPEQQQVEYLREKGLLE